MKYTEDISFGEEEEQDHQVFVLSGNKLIKMLTLSPGSTQTLMSN